MAITLQQTHFDVLGFVKKLKELGASEDMAEYQARTIEQLTDKQTQVFQQLSETIAEQRIEIDALKAKEPATKGDVHEVKQDVLLVKQELKNTELRLQKEIREVELTLQKEIAELKNHLIIWVLGIGITSVTIMCGVVFTLLKLMLPH